MAEKKRVSSTPKKIEIEKDIERDVEKNVENDKEVTTQTVQKKKFQPSDMIVCLSITPGRLFFDGKKTNTTYRWADIGDEIEVEYQDLAYGVRSRDRILMKPRFLIQDKDFIAEFPALENLYSGLYSAQDLKDILKLPPARMGAVIKELPVGAQEALETIVATMIADGSFDSIKRIQKLDEIFDTKMLMRLMED